MIQPAFEILNQRGTPMFFSDVFANRPTAGIVGRIFISTDTKEFYRDTGTTWELIGGPGTGTITGSGTAGTLPIWATSSSLGDSSLLEGASKISTIKDIQADGYYLSGMTAGSGALYWTSDRVTLANYNPTGDVHIEVAGGQAAQVVLGSNLSTTFYGNIIRNGGLSTQFLKADGSLDSSTYITTNIYNGNGTLSGNRVVSLNSNYLSFAGGQTYIGSQTTSSGLLTINNSNADAHVQVVGANSPSIRIDNAGTGATQRFVMGLSTATNNFIQGSTAGDICISTASASPMLFGMWQTINASEVMRLTTANNVLIGSNIDFGVKLYVNGRISAANSITVGDGGTGLSRLFALSGSDLVFNAGGDRMVVRQTGLVGIGTLSPSYQFQVNGTSGTIARITDGTNNLDFYAGSGVNDISATSNLLFSTNTTERLRINSSGNIGVGLIPNASWFSSSRAIQVGSIQAPYLSLFQQLTSTADGYLGWGVYLTGDRTFSYITTGDPVSVYRQNSGIHAWFTAGSGVAGNNVSFTQAMTLTSTGNLLIGTSVDTGERLIVAGNTRIQTSSGSGLSIITNDVSVLTMSSSGGTTKNWGFATTNLAASDFGIYQSNSAGGNPISAGTPKLYFDGNANVGIGTTSPASLLHISTSAGTTSRIIIEEGGAQSALLTTRNTNTNGDLRFQTMIGGTLATRMLIDYSGNVGIGTSSPTDLLTLQKNDGRIRFNTTAGTRVLLIGDDFGSGGFQQIFDASGNVKILFSASTSYFNGTGNVMIGSNIDQGQKLYLNGSFRIDGQTSGTAGGNSGQHLIINCDGTTYKIALLNP